MAAAGKSYYQALQYILEYSGLINYEIHLYPDNDVNDSEFEWLTIRHLRYLPTEIFIHRNMFPNMKDYGVPYEYIHDFVFLRIISANLEFKVKQEFKKFNSGIYEKEKLEKAIEYIPKDSPIYEQVKERISILDKRVNM